MSPDFAKRLNEVAENVEAALDALLGEKPAPGEIVRPKRVLEAMRYGVQQARRGGLTAADVANTQSWVQLKKRIGRT